MSNKNIKIKSLVTYRGIFSGYSFRGKVTPEKDGNLKVIQLKDIDNDYLKIKENAIFINGKTIKEKYYLEDGDILFSSKGANNYGVVFQGEKEFDSVASSAFFVLRLDQTKANPNYVAWYINQSTVQQYLESQATGTYTTSINRETVENIPILLPTLKEQAIIAQIANLSLKERSLLMQLVENKNRLIQNQLLTAIK